MVNVISRIPAVNFCAGQTVATLPLFRHVGIAIAGLKAGTSHKNTSA